jgi:uncharacterized repeat protein (TIGR04138 family)
MPPSDDDEKMKTLQEVAEAMGPYPVEAFDFVQTGLRYTAAKLHGQALAEKTERHISGRQLCLGLRDYAISRWGMLARVVLSRWKITETVDFGRIVFSLVEAGRLGVTAEDSLEDFRDVYDFSTFDTGYQIQSKL